MSVILSVVSPVFVQVIRIINVFIDCIYGLHRCLWHYHFSNLVMYLTDSHQYHLKMSPQNWGYRLGANNICASSIIVLGLQMRNCRVCHTELVVGLNITEHRVKTHAWICKKCNNKLSVRSMSREIDMSNIQGVCRKCGNDLKLGENFTEKVFRSTGYLCLDCIRIMHREFRQTEMGKIGRRIAFLRFNGATISVPTNIARELILQYLEHVGYKCEICSKPLSVHGKRQDVFAVDHDHITGKIRGILCASCNTGLGLLQENIEQARAYLNKEKDVILSLIG